MEELLKELKITLKSLNLEHLARYVDDLYNSVEKTHIAFVGEYNAGKSSLINTLLGKKILAERDLPPPIGWFWLPTARSKRGRSSTITPSRSA